MGIGYWILNSGYWILDIGYWILDIGYWILDIGYWLLEIGLGMPEQPRILAYSTNLGQKLKKKNKKSRSCNFGSCRFFFLFFPFFSVFARGRSGVLPLI